MALNSLFCADVPLSNYSLTPTLWSTLVACEHWTNECTGIFCKFVLA